MPRSIRSAIIIPALLLSAACGRSDKSADSTLNSDLGLASQAQPYTPTDSISAAERGTTTAARAARSGSTAPVRRTARTSTASSNTSSSTGSTGSTAQRTTVVKHTGRDAAIGAAAGAIIGASTSKDKVKGGLIGAAAGGILGGVIGNNVDKQTKPATP